MSKSRSEKDTVLKPNMIFTIEPGLYFPGSLRCCAREDDVLVTEAEWKTFPIRRMRFILTRKGRPLIGLLEVKELKHIFTDAGCAKAVDGVSFSWIRGRCFGHRGRVSCGKSVTSLSIMGLVDPVTGRHEGRGNPVSQGRTSSFRKTERRKIRRNKISMIFQEPATSLNPVFTVGYQIEEALIFASRSGQNTARQRADSAAEAGRNPQEAEKRVDSIRISCPAGMTARVMIAMARPATLSC